MTLQSAQIARHRDLTRGAAQWTFINDGKGLDPARSSIMTALAARRDGGFLMASEEFDTASGSTDPGAVRGNPLAKIVFTLEAQTFNDITSSVYLIEKAALIDGIAETDTKDVFVGMDKFAAGNSWTVERSEIK